MHAMQVSGETLNRSVLLAVTVLGASEARRAMLTTAHPATYTRTTSPGPDDR